MSRKPAVVLTRELIAKVQEAKKRKPAPTNLDLSHEFDLGTGTISNILRGKARPVEDVAESASIEPNESCEWNYDGHLAGR